MKVSALYGDRLSPTSQERIVKAAEKQMDALSNTTRKLKEDRKEMEEISENAANVRKMDAKSSKTEDSDAKKQIDVTSKAAIDNNQVDQMRGIGRNLDIILGND